ncbi:MAG TPA: hypothetical protein VMF35_07250 [Acidimicrobiales bacterium]|nr:hypothetical protein [Acidimicrobiales bacterium]
MARKWRFALVAVVAAALLGGFMPHGVLSGSESAAAQIVQAAEAPLSAPLGCADATCGKGTPAAAAPSPGIVLAAVVGGLAAVAVLGSLIRRRRLQAATLPAGVRRAPFHPPQFS